MSNEIKEKSEETGYIRVHYKKPNKKSLVDYPEAKGVKISINIEAQSRLFRDIVMLDEALLASGRYTERDILDAKALIEGESPGVRICKDLDRIALDMTGTSGYPAMEIVNRNRQDEVTLEDFGASWVFDSTPVKRVVNRDTRTLVEKLKDCFDTAAKIALVMKEMKISEEKASLILPVLEG